MNLSVMPVSNNSYANQNNNVNFKKVAKTKQVAKEFLKLQNVSSINDIEGMQKFLTRMTTGIIGTSALLAGLFRYNNDKNAFQIRVGYPGANVVDYDVDVKDENSLYPIEKKIELFETSAETLNKIPNAHRWNFVNVLNRIAQKTSKEEVIDLSKLDGEVE